MKRLRVILLLLLLVAIANIAVAWGIRLTISFNSQETWGRCLANDEVRRLCRAESFVNMLPLKNGDKVHLV